MVLSNMSPLPQITVVQPVVPFWNRPRVQTLLPFISSLLLHAVVIGIGVVLFKAVQLANTANHDQVIIPSMAAPNKARLQSAIVHPTISSPSKMDVDPRDEERPFQQVRPGGNQSPDDAFTSSPPLGPNPGIAGFGQEGKAGGPWVGPGGNHGSELHVGKEIISGNGRKIIFLCDASGSMLSVFGTLKQQMKESINKLDISQGMEFNVIFFSDDNVFPLFKNGMQIATSDNKTKAMDFIDAAVATGGTQPMPAIRLAMSEKPEVLYVLTDGFDQISNFDELLKTFRDGNRDGRMHINCIFLQADEDPKLEQVLKQISTDGHGKFTKVLKSDM